MITIDYFTDSLCIWAYGGQIRLDTLQRAFPGRLLVRQRFISLFADTATRIGEGWRDQGGFEGFGRHMHEVCGQWEHTRLADDVWTVCRPRSCTTAHVFLKAVGLSLGLEQEETRDHESRRRQFDALVNRVREAFFEQARDIGEMAVLRELLQASGLQIDARAVMARIDNGEAYAALHRDQELAKAYGVLGSPTFVFNEGRQLLYGNVGYRIIEANVQELLTAHPVSGEPSWC
jgi:predicted DsbA family dithiol-disulfide isomerase